jgi:hypothetical protein
VTDYFARQDPLELIGMLALGDPAQVGNVQTAWTNIFNGLNLHTGAAGSASGVTLNGTTSSLLESWKSPKAVPAYQTATNNVSQYATDVMSQIYNSGASAGGGSLAGGNTLVGALSSVKAGLTTAQALSKQYAAQVTPQTASEAAASPTAMSSFEPSAISCEEILQTANNLVLSYAQALNQSITQANKTGRAQLPALPQYAVRLADDGVVTLQITVGDSGNNNVVDTSSTVNTASFPSGTAAVTGTLIVTQPSDFGTFKGSKLQSPATLSLDGLTPAGLYQPANEAVRLRAAQAVTNLAKTYTDARNAVVAVHTLPITGLPKGQQVPYNYTGGDGSVPTFSPAGLNSNGANTSGLNSNGANTNGLNSNGANTSGLNSNGANANGLTSANSASPLTSTSTPSTSLAGLTPAGTSGLGLTTPTSTSGLGSIGSPITSVPTTGLPTTGGLGTGGLGTGGTSGGLPIAAGLMPGLLTGGGGGAGIGGKYGGLTSEGTGTGSNGIGESASATPASELLTGENAAANAAREAGSNPGMMYPPMFPGGAGGQGSGNERNRGTYLPDDDVWTEDLDSAPSLIVGV